MENNNPDRVIKFRAWGCHPLSKKGEKMVYDRQDLKLDIKFDGGGFFKIMQYTGIKDKNGKEVYVGDIVRYNARDDKGMVGLVTYGESYYGLGGNIMLFCSELEVLGNMYQNEDLLPE